MQSQYTYDVFISYARQNVNVAHRINIFLARWGFTAFYDITLSLGMDYAASISNGIKDCSAFIFIISEASINSAWCRNELALAIENGKAIIPIRMEEMDLAKVPCDLKDCQIIDYNYFLKYPESLKRAILSTNKDVENHNYSSPKPFPNIPIPGVSKSRKRNKYFWIAFTLIFILSVLYFSFNALRKKELKIMKSVPVESFDTTRQDELADIKIQLLDNEIKFLNDEIEQLRREQHQNSSEYGQFEAIEREISRKQAVIVKKQAEIDSLYLLKATSYTRERNLKEISYKKRQNEQQKGTIIKLRKANKYLTYINIVVIFLTVTITFLFIFTRRKTKRLHTDLKIISDAKTVARIGDSSLLIEKDGDISVKMPVGLSKIGLNYTKYNSPKRINCFIGGSIDLQSERDALRATISVVHNEWREKNFHIFSFTFEDFDKKFVNGGQQSLYDYFIENDANIAIFVVKGEVGEKTVMEFQKAYSSFKSKGHPSIVVYHEKASVLGYTAELLKKQVEETGQYWNDYDTMKEMKYHFQDIISTDVWKLYEKELMMK